MRQIYAEFSCTDCGAQERTPLDENGKVWPAYPDLWRQVFVSGNSDSEGRSYLDLTR